MNSKFVYMDYAATTPVDEDVFTAMRPYFCDLFFNAVSGHAAGQRAASAVERAREQCATAIGALPQEIYFTSGATEAINWALKCVDFRGRKKIIVSQIEHDAVLACAEKLKNSGMIIEYCPSDKDGIIEPSQLQAMCDADTALVCVMAVNNQVGAIQPIKELSRIAHEHGALFFTDAVQAVNACLLDVKDCGADLLCVSAHKFYAPKGIGFLYVKRGVGISPLLDGGGQEGGLRSGTSNVAAIVGMGKAIQNACMNRENYTAHIKRLSSRFVSGIGCFAKPIMSRNKIPEIVSVEFPGVDADKLVVALSCSGVYCSVGAACSAGSARAPQTLIAMNYKNADSVIRFSMGKYLTVEQIDWAIATIEKVYKALRAV